MDDKGVPGASNERKKGVNEKTKMGRVWGASEIPPLRPRCKTRFVYSESPPAAVNTLGFHWAG